MTKVYCILVCVMILSLAGSLAAESSTNDKPLPIGMTAEELQHLDQIGINHKVTAPPIGPIRNPAEWEPSQGVIIRYPFGISYSLIREYAEDLMVTTIVASVSQQNTVINAYTSNGVNLSHCDFIIASTNSIWTRDYGPWFIFEADGDLAIVDHVYNRPRPYDDLIPQVIGQDWGLHVYGMDLTTTGGNHMSDGLGMSMSTRLVYDENTDLTTSQVRDTMYAYLNNQYTVEGFIESGGIHHIDCWAKFLNPTTILVKDVPNSWYPMDSLLQARADSLSQQISAWGRPYTIVRVYCPTGTAYTNSIILNNKVFVPTFGSSYDDVALQVYRDAMPGYEVLGFDGDWLDDDAIHCRAMGVPDSNMLFINHVPLFDTDDVTNDYYVGVRIEAHSGRPLIDDSLKIFYDADAQSSDFVSVPLYAAAQPDSFYGYIPAQPGGTTVRYFIQAADESGRVETHPFIGEPWAHTFQVEGINVAPQIVAPDSLVWQTDRYHSFCPEIVDPDDSVHQITYSNYPDWLSVVDDSLTGISCDTNVTFTFNVAAADQANSVDANVKVIVYVCGDVNSDNIVNISDAVSLIGIVFGGATPPSLTTKADADCNGIFNISDAVYLIGYIFGGGPAPCDGC